VLLALPASLRNRIAGAIADAATEWRFVSAPLRDALLQSLPPDLARRVRAPVAASPIELPDIRDDARHLRETLGANGTIAVTVGRLVPEKQVDRVLEHAARIGPKLLVVVGDGPERARLERLARGVGVNARFVGLVGRREALAWIGAADVLWHASRAEGLSTVVREAAALGIPVEWV
jgi:glycosyltransferase involved in cell wall biosynthesis